MTRRPASRAHVSISRNLDRLFRAIDVHVAITRARGGGVRFWRDFRTRETALLRVESAPHRAKSACHGGLGKRNDRGDYREIDRDLQLFG